MVPRIVHEGADVFEDISPTLRCEAEKARVPDVLGPMRGLSSDEGSDADLPVGAKEVFDAGVLCLRVDGLTMCSEVLLGVLVEGGLEVDAVRLNEEADVLHLEEEVNEGQALNGSLDARLALFTKVLSEGRVEVEGLLHEDARLIADELDGESLLMTHLGVEDRDDSLRAADDQPVRREIEGLDDRDAAR